MDFIQNRRLGPGISGYYRFKWFELANFLMNIAEKNMENQIEFELFSKTV